MFRTGQQGPTLHQAAPTCCKLGQGLDPCHCKMTSGPPKFSLEVQMCSRDNSNIECNSIGFPDFTRFCKYKRPLMTMLDKSCCFLLLSIWTLPVAFCQD